jgi:hypothetical protein
MSMPEYKDAFACAVDEPAFSNGDEATPGWTTGAQGACTTGNRLR